MLQKLITECLTQIDSAENIWLSTHKNSDGDGLGSEVAFYLTLQKMGKKVFLIHNDKTPDRYQFLFKNIEVINLEANPNIKLNFQSTDIALIFDTHEEKLCTPFFEKLQEKKTTTYFVDHHVPSIKNHHFVKYLLNENACCTGEIVFDIIQILNSGITPEIATALYTSLVFDTQNFKFIRQSSKAFKMAQILIDSGADHQVIQKNIFNNWTVQKMNFLSLLIQNIKYFDEQKIAVLKMSQHQLIDFNLSSDDVSDFIDFFMLIQRLEVAIVLREDSANFFKMSFRGRPNEVVTWANHFDGGGHLYSAGAWVNNSEEWIMNEIENLIKVRKKQVS